MRVTDIEIGEYFDIPISTLKDWKRDRPRRYFALKWSYMLTKHYRQMEAAKEALEDFEKEMG